MIQYIIVNGFPGAGKSTFEQECCKILGQRGACLSSIDLIKDVAIQLGWNGEKTPESRRFLSILKELSTEYFDSTWNYVGKCFQEIEDENTDNKTIYAFVDVREPQEIQRYKDERNAKTVFINRDDVTTYEQSNVSDLNVNQIEYDYYINNNGSLEDLKNKAKSFIIKLESEDSK